MTRRRSRAAHSSAPYAEALIAHAGRNPLMFMVPGHAGTEDGLTEALADFVGERAIAMDIPQLIDGIDVGPGSPFEVAEQLAADAWAAHRSWFLANGSSQGNRLVILAVAGLGLGQHVVAQRSAHSSLSDGLILAGLDPLFLTPTVDTRLGINHGISPEALDAELTRASAAGQTVTAAQVVSPSYFGAVSDVAALAKVAHKHGVPLIVDAAWGAHFGFHEQLPESPAAQGADLVITSIHKMGGGLGQGAMIHLGDGPFTAALEPLIDRAFRLTQTTSASSLLLGSLDVARRSLVMHPELLSESIELADSMREWVRGRDEFSLVSDGFGDFPDIVGVDPLRVAIDVTATGLTGYRVRSILADTDAIFLEIATSGAVVAFFGPGKKLDIVRLQGALSRIAASAGPPRVSGGSAGAVPGPELAPGSQVAPETEPQSEAAPQTPGADSALPPLPAPGPARHSPREAYFSVTEVVPAAEAIGRVSADSLAAYPPGIPNIVPGEEITSEAVDFLQAVAASPIGYVRGSLDPRVTAFRVIAE
ncbi:aminotransferase class I/II-fold pyridoxal phosphate-dependent enzyme [Leucobacter denitrificans]|uniref:DegT/DnrJ/EryC1/StrS family aminotransferase n=1 Tax=Leucobacter denitrificans TaxID=683042 RepID=A0A7G9S356_9MICO|nr:DegT/DnrJ/EryC1/StrS family aminotransferase [Leucobacter denitrificans]QNN62281.1 DegT/DnrJ/EryC1/StrS family aminotransferase [Leucobacter denitrificans]